MKEKIVSRVSPQNDISSNRINLLNTSLVVAGSSIFGYGLSSFGKATEATNVKAALESRGSSWEAFKSNYVSSSHGHNILSNVLVERGWAGVTIILMFQIALLRVFLKSPKAYGSAIGILTLSAISIGGLFQSTLHVEHGQLAFLCLAFGWYSMKDPQQAFLKDPESSSKIDYEHAALPSESNGRGRENK